MPTHPNKISARQLVVLFVVSTLSPTIRIMPTLCSKYGKIAGWTAPVISSLALLFLFAILDKFFKAKKFKDLTQVFEVVLGKAIGKTLTIIYFAWIVILYLLYIRYYAERLLSSMFPNTNIRFFLITILFITCITTRGSIETLARFAEFTIVMFTIVMLILYAFLIPTVRINNLLPLTYYDVWPATKATYPVLALWGYFMLFFFIGDFVFDLENIQKYKKKCIFYLSIMSTVMLIVTIGSLGYKTIQRMPLPFFSAAKLISVMHGFDRFEAFLLSVWVVSDYLIIMAFSYFIMNITKRLFGAKEVKYYSAPVALMGYSGSLYLATSRFELAQFSEYIALPINCVLCFIVPTIVLCIGKIRKQI